MHSVSGHMVAMHVTLHHVSVVPWWMLTHWKPCISASASTPMPLVSAVSADTAAASAASAAASAAPPSLPSELAAAVAAASARARAVAARSLQVRGLRLCGGLKRHGGEVLAQVRSLRL